MKKYVAWGLAYLVSLFLTVSPLLSRSLPSSDRPGGDPVTAPGTYTISMTTQFIEEKMTEFNAVGMSIALVNQDGVVWEEGFGWADIENEVLAEPETVYMIGSLTKFLTTLTLMKLHEQGTIDIDDPASMYLTDFQIQDRFPGTQDGITIRRLVNHHSGLPGDLYNSAFGFDEGWDTWGGCDLYMDYLLDYLADDTPTTAPGTIASYCNTGFILAGEISLRLGGESGEDFPDYMDRVLFSPLGMTQSSLHHIQENLAYGYMHDEAGNPEKLPIIEMVCTAGATGGVYSTVQDMARLMTMVINQGTAPDGSQYLSGDTIAMLGESEESGFDVDSFFIPGLGLDTVDAPTLNYAGRAWGKSGSTGNYVAYMAILPDQKLGAVVLTNSDTGGDLAISAAQNCLQNAVFETTGMPPVSPDLPDYDTVTDTDTIAGTYIKKFGFDTVADNGDGTLTWTRDAHVGGSGTFRLSLDGNQYRSPDREEAISFTTLTHDGDARFVMIQSGSSGSDWDEYAYGGHVRILVGEKIEFPEIPDAWTSRMNIPYMADNIPWSDHTWDAPFAVITETGGVMMFQYEYNLYPESDSLAYFTGLNNRYDSSVRVVTHDGVEKLEAGGYRYLAADQIQEIRAGDSVSGTVDIYDADWYRYEAASAGEIIDLAFSLGQGYKLGVFNASEGSYALMGQGEDGLSWVTTGAGSYYIVISATNEADTEYTMTVTREPELASGPDLQAVLESAVSDDGVPGVVMAARTPEGYWVGAAGTADLDSGQAMTINTEVRIASITKVFAAALIMKLKEEGLLDLSDTVEQWLPGTLPVYGNQITIQMLLNHTSGIPDHEETDEYYEKWLADPTAEWTSDDVTDILQQYQDAFVEPGTTYSYCNTGYYLLGMIAEAATGDTVADAIDARFFQPKGMWRTNLTRDGDRTEPHAREYCLYQGELVDTSTWNMSWDWTAGSAATTAPDMVLWTRAFFNGEMVSRESLEQMVTPVSPATDYGYGLGISEWTAIGQEIISHSGANSGVHAQWLYAPESDTAVFIAMNRLDADSYDVTAEAMNTVLEGIVPILWGD